MTAAQIGVTMVLSLAGALLFDDITVLAGVQPDAWLVVLYLAGGCTILAYLLQNHAVTHSAAAFFLLGETLSGPGLIGAVLIILCLILDGRLDARLYSSTKRGVE